MKFFTPFCILFLSFNLSASTGVSTDHREELHRKTVAATLVLEAAEDGKRGMTAVFFVIKNRSSKTGKSFYQTVVQKGQFATLKAGPNQAIRRAQSKRFIAMWQTALDIYDDNKKGLLGRDFTNGATHFESFRRRKPSWTKKMRVVCKVGDNVFYR